MFNFVANKVKSLQKNQTCAEKGNHFQSIKKHFLLSALFFVVFPSEECSSKGGTNAGSCAQGFGVCCTCKSAC